MAFAGKINQSRSAYETRLNLVQTTIELQRALNVSRASPVPEEVNSGNEIGCGYVNNVTLAIVGRHDIGV